MSQFNNQLKKIQDYLQWSITNKEYTKTVLDLVTQIFAIPFKYLEHQILKSDEFFEAYADIDEPEKNQDGSKRVVLTSTEPGVAMVYQSFGFYFQHFADELKELISDVKTWKQILNAIESTLASTFDAMELQVIKVPEADISRLIDPEVRNEILKMTIPQRILYFLMMEDFNLESMTTNLDGGRCHPSDCIDALKLPYRNCDGKSCVTDKGGDKYHQEIWDRNGKNHLCMQANKYFNHAETHTSGTHDDCTLILQAYHREHIQSLPEKRVKQLIHFLRVVAKEDSTFVWIFNMNGELTKLTSESWS